MVGDANSHRSLDCGHGKLVTEVKPEHPYTNEPLLVSPLTWSHATLVLTVHEYLQRQKVIRQAKQASGGAR